MYFVGESSVAYWISIPKEIYYQFHFIIFLKKNNVFGRTIQRKESFSYWSWKRFAHYIILLLIEWDSHQSFFFLLGIGRALTIRLHSYGASIYALSRTREDLDSLQDKCPGVKTICVNLLDWEATRVALQDLESIDCLINNAAIGKMQPFLEITSDVFDEWVINQWAYILSSLYKWII